MPADNVTSIGAGDTPHHSNTLPHAPKPPTKVKWVQCEHCKGLETIKDPNTGQYRECEACGGKGGWFDRAEAPAAAHG
jgi:hypothetical protein